jgi:hypothetical protein
MGGVSDTLRRLLIVLALAVAAALAVWVYGNAVVGDEAPTGTEAAGVDRLIPAPGSETLTQGAVGIDLAVGYDADLEVNGVRISGVATDEDDDGLRKNLTIGLVEYLPGPGRQIEALASGRNCVVARVWRQEDGPTAANPVSWCFDAT